MQKSMAGGLPRQVAGHTFTELSFALKQAAKVADFLYFPRLATPKIIPVEFAARSMHAPTKGTAL
jgi:hypothetical protein